MAYPAIELITRALYLSDVVGIDLETPSDAQISTGLFLLNELLDFSSLDVKTIPYYRRGTFNLTQNVESYFVDNLYEIELLTFNYADVRYPMIDSSRRDYFATGRVNSIQSLPFKWRAERENSGMRIYVYFKPDQTYVAEYSGKFGLTNVTKFTDLETVYDRPYLAWLRHRLALAISQEYDIEFASDKMATLEQMASMLRGTSAPDMTMKKRRLISTGQTMNWAQVNIGRGYTPT